MRKLPLGVITVFIGLMSCGEEKVESVKSGSDEVKYQIDAESISLDFMAYKTTGKIGVGGEFGKINVTASELADVKEKALNNVSFSVPISSLFTGNKSRDWKLVNLFFGVMDKTEFLSGTFHSHEANMEDVTDSDIFAALSEESPPQAQKKGAATRAAASSVLVPGTPPLPLGTPMMHAVFKV